MIRTQGPWFKDEQGRTLILRGVNLGGSSKVPCEPSGATHLRQGFLDHRHVSFVGRPFPLEMADEHFARLRRWGLTFVRLLVTWEAVEHGGPGVYDEAYLDYLRALATRAADYDISLCVDAHQDVWSRFSGGAGAPGWTLEAVGFDLARLHATGAAVLHQFHGDPYASMIWPTNATKLAAASMFTLFFGGNDFAPATRIEGEPAQDFLQRHYFDSVRQVALRLRDLPNVIGYDTLNEPQRGYIAWGSEGYEGSVPRLGPSPSPLQSMALGAGIPQDVEVWKVGLAGARRVGRVRLNEARLRAWQEGCDCIWRQNGVWDIGPQGEPRLLRPDHFCMVAGRRVDFARDCYRPFALRFVSAVREVHPQALIFVEGEPMRALPEWRENDPRGIVLAAHWYDGFTLFTKRFIPFLAVDVRGNRLVFGARAIRRSFADQLAALKRGAENQLRGVPTLIGEFGIPFNLDRGRAYRTGHFDKQVRAIDRSFRALEANLLSGAIWNYTADNSNARGDQWNGEDFSIFSRDQQADPEDPDSGGRALQAVVRPYPRGVSGEPLQMAFDLHRREFTLVFRHDAALRAPTEVFVPRVQYPSGCEVEVSDGTFELRPAEQLLLYSHDPGRPTHWLRVRPK